MRPSTAATRALAVGLFIAGVLGLLHLLGVGLKLLLALGLVLAFVGIVLPRVGVRWLDDAVAWVRGRFWAREQGHFHSFAGVPLHVEDDGRHVWVDGAGFMRAVGRIEPEDALAARLSGHWRRTNNGVLLLRVDAVVNHLNTMPGREDPRVQRLRRYFERELLFPAATRRQRAGR